MKILLGIFLALIALFTGGCSLYFATQGALSSEFAAITALGLIVAASTAMGARVLLFPKPQGPAATGDTSPPTDPVQRK